MKNKKSQAKLVNIFGWLALGLSVFIYIRFNIRGSNKDVAYSSGFLMANAAIALISSFAFIVSSCLKTIEERLHKLEESRFEGKE